MVTLRKRVRTQEKETPTNTKQKINNETTLPINNAEFSGYEQFRDQRIKENMQRMQRLGILKLKSQLIPPQRPPIHKKTSLPSPLPPSAPPRRSSRLESVTPVSYSELRPSKKGRSATSREICIREGSKPEVYTEEHDKLLGDCETSWILYVDGCDKDGKRIYDQVNGKTCHQCRQKTLGCHTHCSGCNLVQGQFCGDCLYMRYGENVIEANQNPSWICPVCRRICNCSLCRQAKGWAPTGSLYRKVSERGFKSVAHYLIQTRRSQTNSEDPGAENLVSAERSLPCAKNESLDLDKGPDEFTTPQCDDNKDDDMMKGEEKEGIHCLVVKHVDINVAYDKDDPPPAPAAAAAADDDDDDGGDDDDYEWKGEKEEKDLDHQQGSKKLRMLHWKLAWSLT